MKNAIYTIAAAVVLIPTLALASPGDDGCIGNCPQGGTSGGPTEVVNENTNQNVNNNEASAGAIAGSSSDSTAIGIGVGGSSTVGVAVKTGPTISGSKSNAEGGAGGDGGNAVAVGGSSRAYGGDSNSRSYSEGGSSESSVGDVTSSSGPSTASASNGGNSTGDVGVAIDASDNSSYSVEYEEASARAANVYSQVCQNGGSAQGIKGGFGISNSDVLCDHLKMAAVMREAYLFEMEHGLAQCAEPMAIEYKIEGAEWADMCFNEKTMKYYESYHEHMDDAMYLMDKVEEAGMMDKFMGYLVRPAALIGALIWLI